MGLLKIFMYNNERDLSNAPCLLWLNWLAHFYRENLIYFTYPESWMYASLAQSLSSPSSSIHPSLTSHLLYKRESLSPIKNWPVLSSHLMSRQLSDPTERRMYHWRARSLGNKKTKTKWRQHFEIGLDLLKSLLLATTTTKKKLSVELYLVVLVRMYATAAAVLFLTSFK